MARGPSRLIKVFIGRYTPLDDPSLCQQVFPVRVGWACVREVILDRSGESRKGLVGFGNSSRRYYYRDGNTQKVKTSPCFI